MAFTRIIFTLILSATLATGWTQGQIDKQLTARISVLDTANTRQTLQQLANDFERMALAEENNWAANYYTAYTYVQLAYQAKGSTIDAYCDQAEVFLKKADKLKPGHSENFALYAYLNAARVNVNPMTRGSKYGKISKDYIDQAIKANPENPRPYSVRGMGIFNTPKVFGGGKAKAKPVLETALKKFKTFKPENNYSPKWGQKTTEDLLAQCE